MADNKQPDDDEQDVDRTNFLEMEIDEFISPSMRKIKDGVVFDSVQGMFDTSGSSMLAAFCAMNRVVKSQQEMLEQQQATIKTMQSSIAQAVAFEEAMKDKMKTLNDSVSEMRLIAESMEKRTSALEATSAESDIKTAHLESGIGQLVTNLNTMDEHMRILEFNLSGSEAAAAGRKKVVVSPPPAAAAAAAAAVTSGVASGVAGGSKQGEGGGGGASGTADGSGAASNDNVGGGGGGGGGGGSARVKSNVGDAVGVAVAGTSKWSGADYPHHALFVGQLPKELAATKGLMVNLRAALAAALKAEGGDAADANILEATASGGAGVEIVDAGVDAQRNFAVVSFSERAHVAAALFALQVGR